MPLQMQRVAKAFSILGKKSGTLGKQFRIICAQSFKDAIPAEHPNRTKAFAVLKHALAWKDLEQRALRASDMTRENNPHAEFGGEFKKLKEQLFAHLGAVSPENSNLSRAIGLLQDLEFPHTYLGLQKEAKYYHELSMAVVEHHLGEKHYRDFNEALTANGKLVQSLVKPKPRKW